MKQYSEAAVLTAKHFDAHGNVLPAVVLDLFQKAAGDAEINVLCGGQPVYSYILSFEG